MTTGQEALSLLNNAKRLLRTLGLKGARVWVKECRIRLERLCAELEAHSLTPNAESLSWLELEFYSIIETHPKVRQASMVVFKEEILEICEQGLESYRKIQQTRSLTEVESEQLRLVKEEHWKTTAERDSLLKKFLDEQEKRR